MVPLVSITCKITVCSFPHTHRSVIFIPLPLEEALSPSSIALLRPSPIFSLETRRKIDLRLQTQLIQMDMAENRAQQGKVLTDL